MVYAGAGGNTSKQLQQHLKFPDDKKALEEAVKGLLSTFGNNKDVTLSTANGMYVQRDFELKPAFAKTITEAYKSEVKNLDFSDSPGAAKVINGYVNTNTMGKIKKLYEDNAFSALTKLVLVNTIYFKGAWKHKFDAAKTFKGDFHLNSKDTVQVDYMTTKERFNYGNREDLKANIIELKYNGDVSMVLIVPEEIDGIKQLEEKIALVDLKTITSETYSREVNLTMPKFKLEQSLQLSEPLKKLGLDEMFDPVKANFSDVTDKTDLFVSEAIQKTYIDVNEEGAEAAAATACHVRQRRSANFFEPEPINVDHPFLFLVTCEGVILFLGRLLSPDGSRKLSETAGLVEKRNISECRRGLIPFYGLHLKKNLLCTIWHDMESDVQCAIFYDS
ncbi:hypothetical protein RUM43_001119 [Polyplax serrata]|uniref:Serpin domain-containing protein n=1 Tax=Polyplax serrata TaxID=468196 RepID=A0AAN8XRJ7_POLSC